AQRARRVAADRRGTTTEDLGNLVIVKVGVVAQDNDTALPGRQLRQPSHHGLPFIGDDALLDRVAGEEPRQLPRPAAAHRQIAIHDGFTQIGTRATHERDSGQSSYARASASPTRSSESGKSPVKTIANFNSDTRCSRTNSSNGCVAI